jgi:hypothetical protein
MFVFLPLTLCVSDRPVVTCAPASAPPAALVRADVPKDNSDLPSQEEMTRLARTEPVVFLTTCLGRFNGESIKGYTLTLQKQERMEGKLYPAEVIEVAFRASPHSVLFKWTAGARLADRVLYVDGENDGKMLARPSSAIARLVVGDVVSKDVDGAEARRSGRYLLTEFGFKNCMERTLRFWKAATEKGAPNIEYLGVKKVKEAGNRSCWAFRRISKVSEDGVKESTILIDCDRWIQVGVVLKDEEGKLLGSYYFRDVLLNPEFEKGQFTPTALKP